MTWVPGLGELVDDSLERSGKAEGQSREPWSEIALVWHSSLGGGHRWHGETLGP